MYYLIFFELNRIILNYKFKLNQLNKKLTIKSFFFQKGSNLMGEYLLIMHLNGWRTGQLGSIVRHSAWLVSPVRTLQLHSQNQ